MAESLSINNKKYLPSTELSKEFGYTSDYISKLAREEKILATRIGRQWFVEPESLRTFSLQADIEKKLRKESLRAERALERSQANQSQEQEVKSTKALKKVNDDRSSLLQSVAVLSCSALVGFLSWTVSSNDIETKELLVGAEQLLALVSESVQPNFLELLRVSEVSRRDVHFGGEVQIDLQVADTSILLSQREVSQSEQIFTMFPETSISNNQESFSVIKNVQAYFSDEVLIEVTDGTYTVQPIFKESVGEVHEFVLEPIVGSNSEQN